MDPVTALGAAGSVVGIAGFGIQLSQILIQFVSQVRSAQDNLEEVVAEIDSTTDALEEIYGFLKQDVQNVEARHPLELFSESSLTKVRDTAGKCLVVFWRIETAIAGSEPDGFEDELAKRLTSFNRKLASYRLDRPIKIKCQIALDPLGVRDRFLWAFRASKLERFCKELQRYRNHLVLLLQIVILGQQQAKRNPTEQDILLMRQTYAIIVQTASPKELRQMALEAQEEGERRRGRSRGPVSTRVSGQTQRAPAQRPTRSNSSTYIRPHTPVRPHSPSKYQSNRSFSHHDTTTNNRGQRSSPRDQRAYVNGTLSTQPQQPAPGKHATNRSAMGQRLTPAHTPDVSSSSAEESDSADTSDVHIRAQVTKEPPSATVPNEHGPENNPALDPRESNLGLSQVQEPSGQQTTNASAMTILPYVIKDDGAYRLPLSLQPARGDNAVVTEHDIAIALAFLSPGQLHTLQCLLQSQKEVEPRRLARLDIARQPARKLWQRQKRVMVAFIEGTAPDMPWFLLQPVHPSGQSSKGTDYVQSLQQIHDEGAPSVIGLPRFQDVTNDLMNNLNAPWGQVGDRERFAEYRVWYIEPYPSFEKGGESTKDWTRGLLREELLPRAEVKRRLRTLDKDPATTMEKTASLTISQQSQVWRSIEAAKQGDPDPDYQWGFRQLEIIRYRRFWVVKQVKAIVVYVSKTPHLLHQNTSGYAPHEALDNPPHEALQGASNGEYVDTGDHVTTARRRSGSETSTVRIRSGLMSRGRQDVGKGDHVIRGRAGARSNRMTRSESRDEAIARANSAIASRHRPSPSRRRTLNSSSEDLETGGYDSVKQREREREYELRRKIQRLEYQIRQEREREKEDKRKGHMVPETGVLGRVNTPYIINSNNLRSQDNSGLLRQRGRDYDEYRPMHQNSIHAPVYELPRSKASVRFLASNSSAAPKKTLEYDDYESEEPRIRYPSQFDRRQYNPRASSRPVAESQNAVEQLLLEWTPAYAREDDNEASTGNEDNDSDTGSEGYAMAEEFLDPEQSTLQHEQAENGTSTTRADDIQWHPESGMGTVSDTGGPQLSRSGIEEGAVEKAAPVSRDWGAPWKDWPGVISSSPQQLSRPSSKNANEANGISEIPRRDASRSRRLEKPAAQRVGKNAPSPKRNGKIVRASTLPQAPRQPWPDEDWARQIVGETAKTTTEDDDIQVDRLKERRATFNSPTSTSRGLKSKAK